MLASPWQMLQSRASCMWWSWDGVALPVASWKWCPNGGKDKEFPPFAPPFAASWFRNSSPRSRHFCPPEPMCWYMPSPTMACICCKRSVSIRNDPGVWQVLLWTQRRMSTLVRCSCGRWWMDAFVRFVHRLDDHICLMIFRWLFMSIRVKPEGICSFKTNPILCVCCILILTRGHCHLRPLQSCNNREEGRSGAHRSERRWPTACRRPYQHHQLTAAIGHRGQRRATWGAFDHQRHGYSRFGCEVPKLWHGDIRR